MNSNCCPLQLLIRFSDENMITDFVAVNFMTKLLYDFFYVVWVYKKAEQIVKKKRKNSAFWHAVHFNLDFLCFAHVCIESKKEMESDIPRS